MSSNPSTIQADYIIVGSGLTGSTIARMLADQGRDVVILDRKDHIAGNVFDYRHDSGIMVHRYGPHYFRCKNRRIWDFLNRFSSFYDWSATIRSRVGDEHFSWPVNENYVNALVGTEWNLFEGEPANFEEACLSRLPQQIYEIFIKGYTEKQWGVQAATLSKKLANRISLNRGNATTLTPNHRWNALPANGYTEMVRGMIGDIPVHLNFDYFRNSDRVTARRLLVFTGLIDEFFGYKFGKLKYRGQNRKLEYFPEREQYQPCIQVNYPSPDDPRIRTIEWKHLMRPADLQGVRGTVVTHETPLTPDDPTQYEYPFPDATNASLYKRYRAEANKLPDALICGRLGEYRYYDMDHAIGRAMQLGRQILKQ